MSDFMRILVLVCGSSLICVLLLLLLAVSLLRTAGRPGIGVLIGLVPALLSVFGGLFGRRGRDESEEESDYVAPSGARPSADALRTKAQSSDFDALVAQKLNTPQTNYTAQSAPPVQPGVPPTIPGVPPKTGIPPAQIPTATAPFSTPNPAQPTVPTSNVPPASPTSDWGRISGARPETTGYPTQFGTEPGRPAAPPPPPSATPEDLLGPLNKPNLRNRPGSPGDPSRRRRPDNAADDELFGGVLDGDGDGFMDG